MDDLQSLSSFRVERMKVVAYLSILLCALWLKRGDGAARVRAALIVTLAGDHKLAQYFEWTCKTIGASKELFDMLVFHESNSKVLELACASNVKLIDVGPKGLSKLILDTLTGSQPNDSTKGKMSMMLNDILLHNPRYLVEIKPMLGDMLQEHLAAYTHWSYTDPDIIWGNLADWVELSDLERFDIITFTKTMDAGRLFLRGQIAIHKNEPSINHMWKRLDYLTTNSFTERLGNAFRMLQEKKTSDEIFYKNFVSAEGWYSQLVFQANTSVKIIGRGFDDFYRHPVVVYNGRLTRCGLEGNLTGCVDDAVLRDVPTTVHTLPAMQLVPAKAYYEPTQCKMFWLPNPTRYCIAAPVYEKKAVLDKDTKTRIRLQRVGESIFEHGEWSVNDEKVARRQMPEHAAFFHFRHWDDFVAKTISTTWNREATLDAAGIGCMVLYLRKDGAMAFEACDLVKTREAQEGNVLLVQAPGQGETVAKTLTQQRKESEVGPGDGTKSKRGRGQRSKAAAGKQRGAADQPRKRGGGETGKGKSDNLRSQRKERGERKLGSARKQGALE